MPNDMKSISCAHHVCKYYVSVHPEFHNISIIMMMALCQINDSITYVVDYNVYGAPLLMLHQWVE